MAMNRRAASLSAAPVAAVVRGAGYRGDKSAEAANDKEEERQDMDDGRSFHAYARIQDHGAGPEQAKDEEILLRVEEPPRRADQLPDAEPAQEGEEPGLPRENDKVRAEQLIGEIGQRGEYVVHGDPPRCDL